MVIIYLSGNKIIPTMSSKSHTWNETEMIVKLNQIQMVNSYKNVNVIYSVFHIGLFFCFFFFV